MRILPKIPYTTITDLILNKKISNKHIDYFIALCKECDSNGIIKGSSKNSLLERLTSTNVLNRMTGYRAINSLLEHGLIQNKNGNIYITDYIESFQEGNKGTVDMPMLVFDNSFKKLHKNTKRLALYFIKQLRNIVSKSNQTFSIKNLSIKLNVSVTKIYQSLDELERYFDLKYWQQGQVISVCIKSIFRLKNNEQLCAMTSNLKNNENAKERKNEIENIVKDTGIESLLSKREDEHIELLGKKETSSKGCIELIVSKLEPYSVKDCNMIINILCSKLRQFTDPITNFQAYLNSLIKHNLPNHKTIF